MNDDEITISVTHEQHERFYLAAKEVGQSLEDWARYVLLAGAECDLEDDE